MAAKGEFAIIILAAGSSSRMGQSKQQLIIDGKSLIVHSIDIAQNSNLGDIIVVLGSDAKSHHKLIKDKKIEIVINPWWQAGMGSSLKAGLNYALDKNSNLDAIIVTVCDQPLLTSNHLISLIEKGQKTNSSIVASAYSGTTGVPALFHKKHFPEILNLEDSQGAKKIIQQHPTQTIDFPEGAIDLDTPEDYKSFIQNSKKMP